MNEKKQNIRLLVMDSDGTLTDGRIFYGSDNQSFVSFSVKDGYGIKNILPQHKIVPVIITGRNNSALQHRAADLGVHLLFQAIANKEICLRQIVAEQELTLEQVAYIGDDDNDSDCIKICGLSGCPADASKKIKQQCHFVSQHNGGSGAVREFIDWLIDT